VSAAARRPRLPADDISRLRLALLRVARRLRQNASGMTQSQLSALTSVQRDGPLTIGQLAAIENVQPPSISRIVGTLEGEGWVARVADPADGRVALVETTEAGDRQLAQLRADRDAWLARRLDALDPADVTALFGAIGALERLFEATDEPPAAPPPRTDRSRR
jgi:DNA-binding MarR family transcriptional regulator